MDLVDSDKGGIGALPQVPAEPVVDKLETDADGGELFGIHVVSFFLTLITLGIYRFWWKTRVRRYMLSHVRYKDDAFEYTGTGLELFVGFIIVFIAVLVPIGAIYAGGFWLLQNGREILGGILLAVLYLSFIVLFGAAIYRAYKYRLSRTMWRGIRFGLSGSSIGYSIRFILYTLLQVVTLWLATPFVTIRLYHYMLNNVWLGSGQLHFSTDWKPLFKIYLVPGLVFGVGMLVFVGGYVDMTLAQIDMAEALDAGDNAGYTTALDQLQRSLVLIGVGLVLFLAGTIALFWYQAAVYRAVLAGCTFEGVAFSGQLTGGRFFKFNLFNWFILIFSFGLAYPWVQVRWLNLMAEVVEIRGEPDFARISQSTADMPKFGEGLAEAFL